VAGGGQGEAADAASQLERPFDAAAAIDYSGAKGLMRRGTTAIDAWGLVSGEGRVLEEHPREAMGRALGLIPSGIFVVTATRGGVRSAYVGSWIQQAAFEPPAITIAMNKHRPLLSLLEPGSGIGVNILGRRQAALYARFEKGFSLEEDPFVGEAVTTAVTGAPLLEEAFAYLDCRVRTMLDAGDHVVVLAEVLAGAVRQSGEPMTYTRRSGFTY
jgi:flavin reductase (DIM6/NTAB) family NADH-FMN oxidoreductase RutF